VSTRASATGTIGKRLIYTVPALVFLAIAVMFFVGLGRDPQIVPSALIGKPVPRFALPPLLESKPGLESADLSGRVVLVNLFASWCLPCREEHPLLNRLAAQGVTLYGIDYKDKPDAARGWLENLGDPYQRIGADRDGRAAIDWGVYGVPETFVVDAAGTIQYKQVGPLTPDAINDKILPLLHRLSK
jgi:cytochrome c biogenesis protein CcmG/thiol:disulfide interchange protein DsbE